MLALGPALAHLARRHLGLVVSPLGLGARLGPGLEATPGRVQPVAQGLSTVLSSQFAFPSSVQLEQLCSDRVSRPIRVNGIAKDTTLNIK